MTNREYMIALLSNENFIDDGGASYKAMIYNYIRCPYYPNHERCHCRGKEIAEISGEECSYCKMEWLDQEVEE